MMKIFLTITTIALLFSCQEPTTSTDQEEMNTEESTDASATPALKYKEDYIRFKYAVKGKDIEGIEIFAISDDVDASELLMYMENPVFLSALMKSNFVDLELQVTEAGESYVFEAYDSETNSDGFEMESAVLLYFTKGKDGLKYHGVAIAG